MFSLRHVKVFRIVHHSVEMVVRDSQHIPVRLNHLLYILGKFETVVPIQRIQLLLLP